MSHKRTQMLRGVYHLSTTSRPPSASEKAYIRETLDEIHQEKSGLQLKRRENQERLEELDREQEFFEPMIAPIRHVPPEVLGIIFAWALVEDRKRQDTLAMLCQVCKPWRKAAHLVPEFWQRTVVDPGRPSLSFQAVRFWMSHAGSLPKTLKISSFTCGDGVPAPFYEGEPRICSGGKKCLFSRRTLTLILKEGPALSHVEIRTPSPECMQNFSAMFLSFESGLSTYWDSTPSASINTQYWEREWENIPTSTFSFLPRGLRALRLTLPHIRRLPWRTMWSETLEFGIPTNTLQALTSLSFDCSWQADHIFKLLQRCVNIKILRLNLGCGRYNDWDRDDAFMQSIAAGGVVLPRLRTLDLVGVEPDTALDPSLLRLPALDKLSLTLGHRLWHPGVSFHTKLVMHEDNASTLSAFIRGLNTPVPLKSLKLVNGDFQGESLRTVVEQLGFVEHLTLENMLFNPEALLKISPRRLPRLEGLDLLSLHKNSDNTDDIEKLFQARGVKFKTSPCTDTICTRILN